MTTRLDTPVLDDGIRNSNWFQGRLLAAEDLQTEQTAERIRNELLGRAIGPGVIHGLMVEWPVSEGNDGSVGAATRVRITRGAAINRKGQLVRLGTDVVIALADVDDEDDAPTPAAGLFRACPQTSAGDPIDGDGVALLVMRPASGFRERAPASALQAGGTVVGCGDRDAVAGSSFRLVPWRPSAAVGADALVDMLDNPANANQSLLRNLLAHRFLGGDSLPALAANPLLEDAAAIDPGPVGDLRREGLLDDCDVPLALIYWPPGGIAFVDVWPVRRALAVGAPDDLLAAFHGPGVAAAGHARLLQFQRQLAGLLARAPSGAVASIRAGRDFRYLPPLFVLPIHPGASNLPTVAGFRAFALHGFLTGVQTRPLRALDGALLADLMQRSLLLPAVDLELGERLHVFRCEQNQAPGVQPQVIVTSRHLDALSDDALA